MEDKIKQVIIWRKDLKVRKGKLAAQVAHAAMAFLIHGIKFNGTCDAKYKFNPSKEQEYWMKNSFTKIVLGCDSEEELIELYEKAVLEGLEAHIITDNGDTEFHGVPTRTCLVIGPDLSSRIDPTTGHLKPI